MGIETDDILDAMARVRHQSPIVERLPNGSYRRIALPFTTLVEFCHKLRIELDNGDDPRGYESVRQERTK